MTVTVPQNALILNAFCAIFQNNLLSKDLVTWRKYDQEMSDTNGLTVVDQVGPRYNVTRNSSSVNDLTGGVQDTVFGSEQYKITEVFGSSMGWGDFVKIRDIKQARESEALKNAAINLAEVIDAYILKRAVLATNNWLGTPTNNVSTWDDIASGYTRLKQEGVMDADLMAVLDYRDKQALGSNVIYTPNSLEDEASGIYRNGFNGMVNGIRTMFTQQLPAMLTGSRVATATSLTNYPAGDPEVLYSAVAISSAPGNYMTSTINFDGQLGAVTVREGEVFTIAGVYAYDNRARKQLNYLQQFRVIGGTGADGDNAGVYTAAAGAFSNVRIFPAIITSGPHQTVVNTNAGWDNLAITHVGAASSTLSPRLILEKGTILVHTADLIMPATGTASRKALTKLPLSVRMWQDSVFTTGEHRIRFDVCVSADVKGNYRPRGVRINGA